MFYLAYGSGPAPVETGVQQPWPWVRPSTAVDNMGRVSCTVPGRALWDRLEGLVIDIQDGCR